MDDMTLLREYATRNSEAAFEALVSRRVNFVYSAALRQVRDPHLAEEITQAVFIILAQKAGRVSEKTILTGWLFKTTRFAALAQTRAAAKRRQREQEAQMQSELQPTAPDLFWEQMSPLLDEALASLGETDRQAVLLRFFENKSLAEVGSHLGTGEDTARKRVSRALEKLHRYFSKRGASSKTAIIAGAMSANSVQAAPAVLAKSVTAVAIAKGAAASGSTLTLIKGALKLMAWTKIQTATVTSAVLLLAVGTTTVTVKEIQKHKTHSWQLMKNFDPPWSFDKMPQQVGILPTEMKSQTYSGPWAREVVDDGRFIGIAQPIQTIIECAFHVQYPNRVVYFFEMPTNKYDFIATLHHGSGEVMQQEIRKEFDVVGKFEMVKTNALLLKVKYLNAVALKSSVSKTGSTSVGNGIITATHGSVNGLAYLVENHFKVPVIDQTGLTKFFDFEISWDDYEGGYPNLNGFKQALLDRLGLELVPTNMPIEMLVVEKVN